MKELYSSDILEVLKKLYYPKVVEDTSDMDGSLSFLIAINNKGFSANAIEIADGIYMETLDKAIAYKDLYYLEIEIIDDEIIYTFLKYLKGSGDILKTSKKPFKASHKPLLNNLATLSKMYELKLKED